MTLPDVEVLIEDAPAARSASSLGNWFIAGLAERGPINTPVPVSRASFASAFGARQSGSPFLYDSVDVFGREGGLYTVACRLGGPNPTFSSGMLIDDDDEDSLSIKASSPGIWGADIDVVVDAGVGSFTIAVSLSDVLVETSPALTTVAEAVAWAAASSNYIDLVDEGGATPVDQTESLTGGTDDRNNIGLTQLQNALNAFTADYGPGQVSLPGNTTSNAHNALLAHADTFGRIARLDLIDTDDAEDLVGDALALRSVDGHRFAGAYAPWDVCPGVLAGTERTVPPSARAAALFSRGLAELNYTAGDPAAGLDLPARYVTGFSQDAWSDDDREALNDAGINVSVVRGGSVVQWGNRTLTSDVTESNWAQLSQSTVVAAVKAGGQAIGEAYVHDKVDGRGRKVGDLGGRLEALCQTFYDDDDLYGETAEEAFVVVPSSEVNDASATLLASIELQTSPGSDRVEVSINKTPTNG